MAPPEAPKEGPHAARGESAPAVPSRLQVLRKRSEFLRASRGRRVARPGFVLQALRRPDGEAEGIRVGFTCSKKVGNAVARNRAKRRLREIARLVLLCEGRPDHDYVLVGRHETTADLPFETLKADLSDALQILHGSAT